MLQLQAVQEGDRGRYTCEAANAAGRDRLHYELEVLSEYRDGGHWIEALWQPHNHLLPAAPAIHGGTEDLVEEVTATVNGTVRFECEATGHPEPTVSWLWDDLPIEAGPRHQLLEGGTVLQVGVALSRWQCWGETQETADGGDGASFPPQKDAALVSPRFPWEPQHLPSSGQPSACSPCAGGNGGGR